jgi:hypothetical protein
VGKTTNVVVTRLDAYRHNDSDDHAVLKRKLIIGEFEVCQKVAVFFVQFVIAKNLIGTKANSEALMTCRGTFYEILKPQPDAKLFGFLFFMFELLYALL